MSLAGDLYPPQQFVVQQQADRERYISITLYLKQGYFDKNMRAIMRYVRMSNLLGNELFWYRIKMEDYISLELSSSLIYR